MHPLGVHVSISGGIELAFGRGEELGCTAIQLFTKNASQWQGKPIDPVSAQAFRSRWAGSPIGPVFAHDSYLINLAAPDEIPWQKSIAAFLDEMERCATLGITDLVMHPGAHLGTGEAAGLDRISTAFRRIFSEAPPGVTVLLENTAGQGSYLGARFEHLAQLMAGVPAGRFGVCFDTCHAFAAGHDLSTADSYRAVMAEFDRIVGSEHIRLFHLNDCKKACGSRVDRHEHIGRGTIGAAGFQALLRDPRFATVPKILETPKGDANEFDRVNLALLRKLAGEGDT